MRVRASFLPPKAVAPRRLGRGGVKMHNCVLPTPDPTSSGAGDVSMTIAAGMIALGESFRDMATGAHALDALDRQFAAFGATHFLATGLPLPGRPIDQLIVRMNWGDRVGSQLNTDDPVLHR